MAQQKTFDTTGTASQRQLALSLKQKGDAEKNFDTAIAALEKATSLFQALGDSVEIAHCNLIKANKYFYLQFNTEEALNNALLSIAFYERSGNIEKEASALRLIGNIYTELDNDEEALKSSLKAMDAFTRLNDSTNLAYTYNNIGFIYNKQKKYDQARSNHFNALAIYKALGKQGPDYGLPYTYGLLGETYIQEGEAAIAGGNHALASQKLDAALPYFDQRIDLEKQRRLSHRISYVDMGQYYFLVSKIKPKKERAAGLSKARDFVNKSMNIALSEGFTPGQVNGYGLLYEIDALEGNYKQAFEHYTLYILHRDSLVSQDNIEKANAYRTQYEFVKKENQIRLLSTENKLNTVLAQKESQRKKFAIACIGIILLAGGYGFYRFRKKNQVQYQQSLMNERLRISRELHDEVGATLSGISMYSHLTREQLRSADHKGVENSLEIMQQSAVQMINKLNDIVWLMNPEQDSLQKLVQRLEEYARNMASVRNMQVKLDLPAHLQEHLLPVEKRRNIYLFCKEAINNAVKYSEGTCLELSIRQVQGMLEFSIGDNGKGFDVVTVRRGNGLENMQKRADELDAKLYLQSQKDKGVVVSMQLKIR